MKLKQNTFPRIYSLSTNLKDKTFLKQSLLKNEEDWLLNRSRSYT
jgi:hypothetical protein